MQCFSRIEGVSYFTRLIERLGKENLERGYSWGNQNSRKVVFSSLIKKCYPKPEETVEDLISAIKDLKITKKRWIELALYAPQWASWISEVVNIKQFESAVWFFHAHASDYGNAEKETILARYSQVSKSHLDQGAIDIAWFNLSLGRGRPEAKPRNSRVRGKYRRDRGIFQQHSTCYSPHPAETSFRGLLPKEKLRQRYLSYNHT